MLRRCKKCKRNLRETRFSFSYSNEDKTKKYRRWTCRECEGHPQRMKKLRETPGSGPWWWNRYNADKWNAKYKTIPYTLTFQQWRTMKASPCTYCGVVPDALNTFNATIDKKDPALGYTPENCVAACRRCNAMKSNWLTHDEMKKVARFVKRLLALRPA